MYNSFLWDYKLFEDSTISYPFLYIAGVAHSISKYLVSNYHMSFTVPDEYKNGHGDSYSMNKHKPQ